ncbi:ligand-binding sensor domain-containing protein [Spirosoma rigui]|uniref:ligand-binding sensor domain-containing protein n=1 Tax=Spirosoma rigui TaxID=564064 RepID=UPI0009AF9FB0|nr:sensor histidine kinase [Spirosoma rigui]
MRSSLLVLLLPLSLQAQPNFSVRHLTTRDGLSQGSCAYIHKDTRGFVWMSSQNGLNRFDGTHFTNYRFDEQDTTTIGKGEVRGIVETPDGDLWVGTEECLNHYVRRTNSFKRVYTLDSRGRRLPAIQEPFFADDSTVWYASSQTGLIKLNYRTGRRTVLNASVKPKFSIATEWLMAQPETHSLVYLLPTGFARYNYQTRQLTTFFTGQKTDRPVASAQGQLTKNAYLFQSIYRCRTPGPHQGNYCLAGPQGIAEFDASLTRLVRYHPLRSDASRYRLMGIAENKQGHWWIGAEGLGVWLYDPDSQTILREIKPGPVKSMSLQTNQISEVYVDDLDLVWVNADPFGIDVIYPKAYTVETLPDDPTNTSDLNNHPIRGLCEDTGGRLWIGTIDGGIRRYDPETGIMNAYTAKQGVTTEGNVRHIIKTSTGQILVANLQGILQYDARRDRFMDVPNPLCHDADCHYARGLCELPDGHFVLATYGGLFLLNNRLKPIARVDSNGTYFGSLYFDATTNLLYAGRRDQDLTVYAYRNRTLTLKHVTLPGFNSMGIYPDQTRRCLWLTTDRGFVKYDPVRQRPIRIYTVRDGLPDDVVYGLLPDARGQFWLSTNNGLARFVPDKGTFSPIVSTRNREYNSHASLISSDGTFYFGGVHGLDRFVPKDLESYRASVPVWITDFQVNDKPYRAGDFIGETKAVALHYQERTISIRLAALDYFNNGNSQFIYRLSGADPGWVTLINTNLVRYTDLSPGRYVFQVRAVDARGQPTPTARFLITIAPPLWKQWWFWTLCLLLLLGLVAFVVNSYNRQKLIRQRRLLENILATQEEERRRIARDLHDDVGNTLAAIKGVLGRAKDHNRKNDEIPEVNQAYTLIDKVGKDLRTITHDLMPIEFEQYALSDVVEQLVERANRSSTIVFEFILFGTERRLDPKRELVTYRIIAELIQNALKHGAAGLAIVQLGYHPQQLSVLVETPLDPTQTVPPFLSRMSPGIGQKNINYRAEYLQASLSVDSNAQCYTVMLNVPYDTAVNTSD